jgi:hypothetical protein
MIFESPLVAVALGASPFPVTLAPTLWTFLLTPPTGAAVALRPVRPPTRRPPRPAGAVFLREVRISSRDWSSFPDMLIECEVEVTLSIDFVVLRGLVVQSSITEAV